MQGNFATYIWRYLSRYLEIYFLLTHLSSHLMYWGGIKEKYTTYKIIIQTLPIIICWNLWENRFSAKYGIKKSSSTRIKYLIANDIYSILNKVLPSIQWPMHLSEMVKMVEKSKHVVKVTPVSWKPPIFPLYKLKIYYSALQNPGNIGGGGIFRNAV